MDTKNNDLRYIIEMQDVCFAYKDQGFALENINIKIPAHGLTELCGKNGSGKSTICKLIVGLLKPQSGKIIIDGENAAKMTLAQRGRKIGYLFQNPAQQIFAPEVDEELSFIPRLLGWKEEKIEQRKDELLRFFSLEQKKGEPVFFLSRGEKQRLALAGILFLKPSFLILDEPTTGLDEENREKLAKLMRELLQNGTGILLVSHDSPFVERFEDMDINRITVKNGRID